MRPFILAVLLGLATLAMAAEGFRPPAVPLVACDPYFSIWSRADKLTDVPTVHWTGREQRLESQIVIDGTSYRLMGPGPEGQPALPQTSVEVLPTRTVYKFSGKGVNVKLEFLTPALPSDLDVLSRPVTYVIYEVSASRGAPRALLKFSATAEPSVDEPDQEVSFDEGQAGPVRFLRVGTVDQVVLGKTGDSRRIDWGRFYVGAPAQKGLSMGVRGADASKRPLQASDDVRMQFTIDIGKLSRKTVTKWLMLAYDDEFSIQYFHRNLRPYWRRNGMDAAGLLRVSAEQLASLRVKCEAFDRELLADLRRSGGEKYAQLCSLAYRQTLAGNKLVADANGQPLLFPKENSSNGCLATVDIVYPMAPQFLLFGPSLSKAMLVPILEYASSARWKWPFAPHDLGTYPKANGQVYGGGERSEENQMPVEETGNMLILLAAIAQMEGNADFAQRYWPTLERWASFLEAKGFDPENQLSTDDFMGHLAHQTNLSVKATVGLASFARLCQMTGREAEAERLFAVARGFVAKWIEEADDGDHFRLAFDQPGTWSQKYNLVWDKILALNLYPDSVRTKEMVWYRKIMNPYGVALDSRGGGTSAKLDWSLWTATLTGRKDDFEAVSDPLWKFANETPQRVELSDWYNSKTGDHVGFHARPVVGGLFLKLLYEPQTWRKWAERDATRAAGWAPIPEPIRFEQIVPTSETSPQTWRYTLHEPEANWYRRGFDDSNWAQGLGGFGSPGTPGAVVNTQWTSDEIYLRREFLLEEPPSGDLALRIYHDEDADVYMNGVLVARARGYVTDYEIVPLSRLGRASLRSGRNLLAVRCRQTRGGQGIDVGLVRILD